LELTVVLGWNEVPAGKMREHFDALKTFVHKESGVLGEALLRAAHGSTENFGWVEVTSNPSSFVLVEEDSTTTPKKTSFMGPSKEDAIQQISLHMWGFGIFVLLIILATIVDGICSSKSCKIINTPAAQWIRLLAFALLMSPPTTLADKIIFSILRTSGKVFNIPATIRFYIFTFEGSLGRLLWLVSCGAFDKFLLFMKDQPLDDDVLNEMIQAMTCYQLLAILREFILRWYTRSYQLRNFQKKINSVLFSMYVCFGLSLVGDEEPGGQSKIPVAPLASGTGESFKLVTELKEIMGSSLEERVNYINDLRGIMLWDGGRMLILEQNLNDKDEECLRNIAKRCFAGLSAIPLENLPDVKRSKLALEQMTGDFAGVMEADENRSIGSLSPPKASLQGDEEFPVSSKKGSRGLTGGTFTRPGHEAGGKSAPLRSNAAESSGAASLPKRDQPQTNVASASTAKSLLAEGLNAGLYSLSRATGSNFLMGLKQAQKIAVKDKSLPYIRIPHLSFLFDGAKVDEAPTSPPESKLALEFLKQGINERVYEADLYNGFLSCSKDLHTLQGYLGGHGGAVAMQLLVDAAFYLLAVLSFCVSFGVEILSFLVPLGTILVSASFAIGPSFVQVINSLVFVLITQPYDLGDYVTTSCLLQEGTQNRERLVVVAIDVLTTTFLKIATNTHVIIPNSSLNSSTIENFTRSPCMQGGDLPTGLVCIPVSVPLETSQEQLSKLQNHIVAYVLANPDHWRPDPPLILRIQGTNERGLELLFFAQSRHRFSDWVLVQDEKVKLHMHMCVPSPPPTHTRAHTHHKRQKQAHSHPHALNSIIFVTLFTASLVSSKLGSCTRTPTKG